MCNELISVGALLEGILCRFGLLQSQGAAHGKETTENVPPCLQVDVSRRLQKLRVEAARVVENAALDSVSKVHRACQLVVPFCGTLYPLPPFPPQHYPSDPLAWRR